MSDAIPEQYASIDDWRAEAVSCVGRYLNNPHDAFQPGKQPCNYAGYGLIRINPVVVQGGDGQDRVFAFAKESNARPAHVNLEITADREKP